MFKILKNTLAVILTAVLCLSFAGCHKANETAVTIGENTFSSGYYACAYFFADMQARSKVASDLGNSATDDTKYWTYKVEDTDYSEWVKNKALDLCRTAAFYRGKCKENNISVSDSEKMAATLADSMWNTDYTTELTFGELMELNGVSKSTYVTFMVDIGTQIDSSWTTYYGFVDRIASYFEFLYLNGGERALSDEQIVNELKENYVWVNALSKDISSMGDDEIATETQKMEEYVKRIKNGTNFSVINAEVNPQSTSTTDNKDQEVTGIFDVNSAQVWHNDSENYPYYSYAADMANGEAKVVTVESGGKKTTLLLLVKNDILSSDNTKIEDLKKSAVYNLKYSEYTEEMKNNISALEISENTSSTKVFKVKKVKYKK